MSRSCKVRGEGTAVFAAGAAAYTLLELAWRRRTHWSMGVAGGVSAVLIYNANAVMGRRPMPLKCLVGSTMITAVELVTGLIFNRKLAIWDYSKETLNYKGQICPLFSAIWFVLSMPVFKAADIVQKRLR